MVNHLINQIIIFHQPRWFCWNNEISWNLSYLLEENRWCEVAILFDQNGIAGINRKKTSSCQCKVGITSNHSAIFATNFDPKLGPPKFTIAQWFFVVAGIRHSSGKFETETKLYNIYWSIPANHWESFPFHLLNTIASEFNVVISYSPKDPFPGSSQQKLHVKHMSPENTAPIGRTQRALFPSQYARGW